MQVIDEGLNEIAPRRYNDVGEGEQNVSDPVSDRVEASISNVA